MVTLAAPSEVCGAELLHRPRQRPEWFAVVVLHSSSSSSTLGLVGSGCMLQVYPNIRPVHRPFV